MKRWMVVFGAGMLVAALLSACGSSETVERDYGEPVQVSTAPATLLSQGADVAFSGTVEPIERVRMSTKIMGWVEAIHFEEGEAVPRNATVVRLNSGDIDAKKAQAEAALAGATSHLENVKRDLARIESLYAKKAATQNELDDIRSATAAAEARERAALQARAEVDALLRYAVLRAPFDGMLTRKWVEIGDLANPGQPIVELENTARVKVVAKVPESDVANLVEGQVARIEVPAAGLEGAQSRMATIERVISSADRASRQFDIHVVADNADGQMKSGMYARVIVGSRASEAIVVPSSAVFRRGQLTGLFVVDDSQRARLRWIRIGAEGKDVIEVLSGINPGEQVVLAPPRELLDGQPVEATQ